MTNRAASARLRWRQRECVGNARRARIGQNGIGLRVKILLHPGKILAAVLAGPAVATGRFATNGSDKLISLELSGVHRGGIPGQVNGDSHARRQPVRCEPIHFPELSGERRSNTR